MRVVDSELPEEQGEPIGSERNGVAEQGARHDSRSVAGGAGVSVGEKGAGEERLAEHSRNSVVVKNQAGTPVKAAVASLVNDHLPVVPDGEADEGFGIRLDIRK